MAIKIDHKPIKQRSGDWNNNYEIIGNNIDELVEYSLSKVREKSKDFYKRWIRQNLEEKGESFIDRHAGIDNTYSIYLQS